MTRSLTPSAIVLNAVDAQMTGIPGGEIILRDDRIKHSWRVNIAPFLMSKYLVTQELYLEITGAAPSAFTGSKKPVETVTWRDAVAFCNKLSDVAGLPQCYFRNKNTSDIDFDPTASGYRLPTEAEWEYACKAGTTGARYGDLDEIAWYKANSAGNTHEVGAKMPNSWGLYDMLGNVWEWCTDVYDQSVYGAYRIIRGGGWSDEPRSCLATNRRRSHPSSFKIDDLGFRVARNLT